MFSCIKLKELYNLIFHVITTCYVVYFSDTLRVLPKRRWLQINYNKSTTTFSFYTFCDNISVYFVFVSLYLKMQVHQ